MLGLLVGWVQAESLKNNRGVDTFEYRDKIEKLSAKEREFDAVSQTIERCFAVLEAKRYGIVTDAISSFVASQVRRSHRSLLALCSPALA